MIYSLLLDMAQVVHVSGMVYSWHFEQKNHPQGNKTKFVFLNPAQMFAGDCKAYFCNLRVSSYGWYSS